MVDPRTGRVCTRKRAGDAREQGPSSDQHTGNIPITLAMVVVLATRQTDVVLRFRLRSPGVLPQPSAREETSESE